MSDEMHELTIRSTSLINVPGFFAYLKVMYQTEKNAAITLMMELTNQTIDADGAEAALRGDLKVETLKDSICIFAPGKYINEASE